MPILRLYLLGPFQAELEGRRLVGLAAKVRALVAYLAVEAGRAHRRADLAELLWPERPPGVALSNLRYALRDLRRALGDRLHPALFLPTHDTLQLDPRSDHRLDVAEFRDLSGLGDLSGLQRAVDLYRGPFLEGLTVDSVAFEEWVLFRREHLEREMMAALSQLVALVEAAGERSGAILYARRLVELDSWDEAAHRKLMRLLALEGQRSAALAQYEACRRVLADELGLLPARETDALAQAIRDGRLSAEDAPSPSQGEGRGEGFAPPASCPAPPASFADRERELARLDGFLAQALAGRPQVAFVTGEAGGGKTALLAEFSRRAMARHADLVAACGECTALAGTGDPYQPIRDVLQQLTGDVETLARPGSADPGPRELGAEHSRRLRAFFPVVARALCEEGRGLVGTFLAAEPLARRADAHRSAAAPWPARLAELARAALQTGAPSAAQEDLMEQTARVLRAVSRQQPLLLTLDNLQWVDSGSAGLLFHLARRLGAGRILIVGAYRPAVVALGRPDAYPDPWGPPNPLGCGRHPLEPVVQELTRDLGDIQVDLDQANDQAFVEAILDSEPNRLGASFRQTLAEHTGGNPLFTVELLRSLEERESLVRDATGHWTEGPALDWGRLPARAEAIIAERIGRLPEECHEMLSAASVEGVVFSAEVVSRALGLDRAEAVRQLSGPICQRHRLAHPADLHPLSSGGRLSRYRFRHYLFQSYLYGRLDGARRASLHEATGEALEALYGEGAGEIAPQLAWHFEQAGLAAKAAGYWLRSGQRAARLSAHEEAITLFRRGLGLLQALPASAERARQELALLLPLAMGPSLPATRGWGASEHVEACERAAHLCRGLGDDETHRTVLFQLGNLYQARRSAAHAASPSVARAEPQSGDSLQKAADASPDRLAITPAGPSAASPQEAMDLLELGSSLSFLAQSNAARVYLERCVKACHALPGHRLTSTGIDVEVVCCAWLMVVLWKQGYPDQARERSRQGLARARALDVPMSLGFASLACGVDLHVFRREPEPVRQGAERLLEMARAKGFALFEGHALIRLGWAQALLGEIEPGMEAIRQGLAAAPLTAAAITRPYQLILKADACLAASRASTRSPSHAPDLARAGSRPGTCARTAAGWAEEGLAALTEGLELVDRTGLCHFEAEMWRLRGDLLCEAGAAVEAEGSFRRALAVARGQEARLWELRAAAALVRLLEGRPGRSDECEQARQALADVYGWFTEGFDTSDLAEARTLLE